MALIRGINVSGQKKIKMADLREYLKELGYSNTRTYIQSGNVVFETTPKEPKELESEIEALIEKKYDFHAPVIIRDVRELEEVLHNCPFSAKEDLSKISYSFLKKSPSPEALARLDNVDFSPEKFRILEKTIYLFLPNGAGRAKLTNNFFESKLKITATSRNRKTLCKLIEMGADEKEAE